MAQMKVDPSKDDETAQVSITTKIKIRDRAAGLVEGWLTRCLLFPIYEKELDLLALAIEKE